MKTSLKKMGPGSGMEGEFRSPKPYADPMRDVRLRVEFRAPDGRQKLLEGFWDGGDVWRVRMDADVPGLWTWKSHWREKSGETVSESSGEFTAEAYEGNNPLFIHGSIKVTQDGRRFAHADGTPFFWMADTLWNGLLKPKMGDWRRFLNRRREQGFTVVQCVTTQWRAFSPQGGKDTAFSDRNFSGRNCMVLQPKFFRALDGMVAAVSEAGLVAALVVLWSNQSGDPGQSLSEEDRLLLARYSIARYGAYPVVWFLGGDGDYRGEKAEFWKSLGREVLMGGENRLSGMHPCGLITVADEFRQEPWFHFVGFQSGHGDRTQDVQWLVEGPPAQEWKASPTRPVLDLEPRYEAHLSYQGRTPWDARGVRNGLYWNLLNSPTAGVTYGHHGIWPWCEKPEIPLNHERSGEAPPWYEALESPGALSILPLRRIMDEARWTELMPCPELLAEQPGREDPTRFVAAAATSDRGNALVYLPQGGAVRLKPGILESNCQGRWIRPDTGKSGEPFTLEGVEALTAPDEKEDWLLSMSLPRG